MNPKLNADRFTGHAYVNTYDAYRPTPPHAIIRQALNYLTQSKAECVADLGCGTGISTEIWPDYAGEVFGIEPSEEMLAVAREKRHAAQRIRYVHGYAHDIPLPSGSVDIVSCSQSFHWMEPESTLDEMNRVLRKGGVLVIYDVIWPPAVNAAYEQAYRALFARVRELSEGLREEIAHFWDKSEHLNNVRRSNHFQYVKTAEYHKTISFSREEFIGIAMSQGGLEALLKRGFSEEEIGVVDFMDKVQTLDPPPFEEMTYHYRVIFGKK